MYIIGIINFIDAFIYSFFIFVILKMRTYKKRLREENIVHSEFMELAAKTKKSSVIRFI